MAAEALTTRDVILWCKTNKYTPITSNLENTNTTASEEDDSLMHPLGFCKFCGSLREEHNDNSDDQCPQAPKGWNSKKRATAISSLTSVDLLLNTLEPGWDEQKDTENMDVDVDMDDGREPAFVGTHPNNDIEGISERVEKWALDAETMDIANERTLDWIWSVLGQLRLKSITANDMLFGKDGNLQGPTPNFDVTSAMVQRLTVGNIMAQVSSQRSPLMFPYIR
ncbi:hypothetical protein BDF20DRAFT_817734 [Mycotypha africana]|uniref:uncharacterized protein n=1 Tax=Mycotypha africana TaxID=64632 RepID=UPI0022FFF807|nr:uncharacterized protein BDF20DRAFT_817734 [Mycotypha africana]KAI8981967.1 hypothetical protein BDF20DRAFT_817734 [Mycotypha africana]